MRLRSLLFVPGDRPDRMEKALSSGADALILDLEDSVTLDRKPAAREAVKAFLGHARTLPLFVRINTINSGLLEDDLVMIDSAKPDGLLLPKAENAGDVVVLMSLVPDVPILPIATETPKAIFGLGTYGDVSQHLIGLTWGAEDLPAAIGASTSREPDGSFTPPYELARSLTLFGAHAAGVPAIETVSPDFRDLDRLRFYAERGRRDGFTGMMAIHPAQVPVINAAFTPSEAELAHARRVMDAFAASPGVGALQIDGKMIDAPHLKAAKRLLGIA